MAKQFTCEKTSSACADHASIERLVALDASLTTGGLLREEASRGQHPQRQPKGTQIAQPTRQARFLP